jgi:hypothetical protein
MISSTKHYQLRDPQRVVVLVGERQTRAGKAGGFTFARIVSSQFSAASC